MPILVGDIYGWLGALVLFVLGALTSWRIHGWWRSYRAKHRSLSGYRSEKVAEKMLESRGFEIVSSPYQLKSNIQVDGEWTSSPVRVDFLVARDGMYAMVEVKSTARAANPHFPDTRRQLREYRACSLYPLYLLDTTRDSLHEIDFPEELAEENKPRRWTGGWALAFALGFFLGAGLLQVWWIWQGGE